MDWDNRIMFWVKNVPYLWVDNEDWKKCKRVYLVSPQTRAFDKSGRREKLQTFWEERASFYNDISLVENCSDQVSNYFLASIPPVKRRGMKWWITQPGFPFKHFELRVEGKKFSEEAHFPILTKLKVVSPNSGKYFTEQASPISELNLEDLPDEILSMIAEHSPGLGFGLANKRLAGIWKEKNDLRKFILDRDERAGNPKFSRAFGYKEIRLCIDTGFTYPLEKHFGSWLKRGIGAKKCDPQKLSPALITMRLEGRKLDTPFDIETLARDVGYPEKRLSCLYAAASFGVGEAIGSAPTDAQGELLGNLEWRDDQKIWRKDWFIAGFFSSLLKKFNEGGIPPIEHFVSADIRAIFLDTEPEHWVIASSVVAKASKKFKKGVSELFRGKQNFVWWLFEPEHYPTPSSERLLKFLSESEHPAETFVPGSLQLEDLPDEILEIISQNSPGLGFGLANKRLAGIWREANDLRRFILKKDKRAADPKFSNRFGKDEIELCLNTGFLYPLQKNLYERWSEKKHTPKSSIIFAQVLGERQEMPRVKMFWLKNSRGEKLEYYVEAPDFKELFGESPPKNRRYLDFADNLKKYISFGLGQSFAKRQKENKKEWLFSSFKGRKIYLDFWFVAGYAFENRGRDIDWDELPKKLKGYFREHDDKLYEQEWEIPLHVLELVEDEKNFKSLSNYLVEREYIPKKKMIKFLKENYNYLSGYERSGLMALFASSEKD
uniref:Uncharacterized protein n=1 Tax=Marseillevirus sp. TaxID=2809551 RepID=A0AA96J0S8_9VIRU|nr:hypothetical protein MarFTMF_406 [Marseillevirus sp.]